MRAKEIISFNSPFTQERKVERDSMEFERLQRDCWVSICKSIGDNKEMLSMLDTIETNLQEILIEKYEAKNITFDRINKQITCEIELEEITI